jgi:DNA-binding transcriptional LysR family regulator
LDKDLLCVGKVLPLDGLVEFVTAAEAGSFSAAARALGVSVAHVSRRVAELERSLGVQLIWRSSRQSTLTEAGRLYHATCRTLFGGLEEGREALRRNQDELRGPIRVSVGGHFAEGHLAPLLLRFAQLHPGLDLDIEVSSRNADLVEEGFDLAVRAGPLTPSSMIGRRLAAFPLVTLAAPALLGRLGDILRPEALDPALCLSLGRRAWIFRRGASEHRFQPQGRIHSNSGSTLIQAAIAGMGVVQVPGYYGRIEVARGDLCPILEAWTSPESFEFHIVYPPQRRLPLRVRRLIDVLVAELHPAGPAAA